jgi:molecular chaperone DnaJ
MSKRCYYETLECAKGATVETLKSSYRKLAMKFHPDKNPDDSTAEVRFKEISEAYDILKDDQKRAAYDRFGHAAFVPPDSILPDPSLMCSRISSAT